MWEFALVEIDVCAKSDGVKREVVAVTSLPEINKVSCEQNAIRARIAACRMEDYGGRKQI